MPIVPAQPIEIPATVADKLWISFMAVNAPDLTSPVNIVVQLVPYSSSTGVMLKDKMEEIRISDLFEAAATDETLMAGINALFTAVQKLANDRGLFGATPN